MKSSQLHGRSQRKDPHDLKFEVSGALRRRKRRMSFNILQLGIPFSCLFSVSDLLSIVSNVVSFVFSSCRHISAEQLQRLQFDSCARAGTPRKPGILWKAYSGVPTLSSSPKARLTSPRTARTSSTVLTSTTRPTRSPSWTSRSTSPPELGHTEDIYASFTLGAGAHHV